MKLNIKYVIRSLIYNGYHGCSLEDDFAGIVYAYTYNTKQEAFRAIEENALNNVEVVKMYSYER